MIGALALVSLAIIPAAANAAIPQIVNTAPAGGEGPATQLNWLETFTATGETGGQQGGRQVTLSFMVQHDVGRRITNIKIDEDYNGSDESAAAANRAVTAQQPTIINGYRYSRVTFTYQASAANSGIASSCPTFGGRSSLPRTTRPLRVRAVDDAGQVSNSTTSNINFVESTSCGSLTGNNEDYPFLYQTSQNQTSINTGQNVIFTYRGDDPDSGVLGIGDNITFNGIRWRARRLSDGVTTTPVTVCQGGDNTDATLNVNFPNRGRWVVEAVLLGNAGGGCAGNLNPTFWFRLGAVDVNSPAVTSPNISLGATRPQLNGNTTVTATFDDAADAGQGGAGQDLEWDRNGDSDFVDTAGANPDFAVLGDWLAGLSSPRTTTVNTTGFTPGLKTVCARIGDNGALGGADDIRRTKTACTQYLVDTPPVANAQSQTVESDQTLPLTLAGTDVDGDTLTYTITDAPDFGTLTGSGTSRTYDPDDSFAGTDTFTFQVNDGFGGLATAVVTVRVTPATDFDAAPDTTAGPQNSRAATVEFSSPVDGTGAVAAATFECQLDDGPFAPCASPFTYTDLSDGNHDVTIRATAAGNGGGPYVDPTPATTGFQVDAFPTLTITQDPDSESSSTTATIEFTATEDGSTEPVTTECQLDGGERRPCTSPQTYTDLSSGTHTITVFATDSRGKEVSETRTFDIDADAPTTAITSAPPARTNSTDATIEFSSPSDQLTATFECNLDGAGFVPCTSPQTFTGLAEGPHTFQVRATDDLTNVDPTPASTSWVVDTTAPATTVSAAPAGPVNSIPEFTLGSDEPGSTFQCSIDSGPFTACESPYTPAGPLADGSHTIDVQATDAAGNTDATPELRIFTLDTAVPTISITSGPPEGTTITSPSTAFGFTSPDGVDFACSVDGGPFEPCDTATSDEVAGLADGAHTFSVRTTDSAGNISDLATRNFTVDTTAPETDIDNGPEGIVTSAGVAFEFSSPASDVTGFECSLDGAAFTACTSPQAYSGLNDGPHTFSVRALDEVANTDPTPSARSFTVDTTPQPPPTPGEPTTPPVDPPVDPPAAPCTFGSSGATCGNPSLRSKLRVNAATGRAIVQLSADGGGSALTSTTFRMPNAIRVSNRPADMKKLRGTVKVTASQNSQSLRLAPPKGTAKPAVLYSDGTFKVSLRGRFVTVTAPASRGVSALSLRLTGTSPSFLSTQKRCSTVTFRATFRDSKSNGAKAAARSDVPCTKGGAA